MPPCAVLFDFDGTLADTENVHIVAWERTLADIGWDVPSDECARAAEVDDRDFLAEVFARRKVEDGDVAGWCARKQAIAARMLGDQPRLYPGVPALVGRLAGNGLALAIVTTTWRSSVDAVLGAAGLSGAFAAVVAKEDVTLTKPDPEGYRLALRRLSVAACSAVAIEDSPSGLAAARAAGLAVVALGHRRRSGDWHGEAPYLPDLRDPARVVDAIGMAASGG